MKKRLRKAPKPTAADFLNQGNTAFRGGRFFLAAQAFETARKMEPRNAATLFNLACAKERTGDIPEAATLLTQAARFRPQWPDPAQRLAVLLGRYTIDTAKGLDPHGLLACFAYDSIDQRVLAVIAMDYLRDTTSLGQAVKNAWDGDPDEVARNMILSRTDGVLHDRLMLVALSAGPIQDIRLETLLTAIRRIALLEVPPERFEDKTFTAFLLALIRQSMANDYVFAVSETELAKLKDITANWHNSLLDDPQQIRQLMLRLLYEDPGLIGLSELTLEDCRRLRPRGLGDLLAEWQEERLRLLRLAEEIPASGEISNATSRKVAGQYELHPYPRWRSLQMPDENSAPKTYRRFFSKDQLSFMDKPFKVLIAGCGTGQQAVAAAKRYGPNGDVLAIDLSKASLAYAKARSDDFGVANLRFLQADILEFANSDEGPFDVIESVGVLHHMEDPFKGWRVLTDLLRPGGLMLTGLYSAVARGHLAELRGRSDYPGAGCDSATARQYRASLIAARDGQAAQITASQDFYSLNEFRDLLLHEHERPMRLPEIESFLKDHRLTFRGFQLPSPLTAHFLQNSKGESLPGSFNAWAAYEEQYPQTFGMMYNLWCEKSE